MPLHLCRASYDSRSGLNYKSRAGWLFRRIVPHLTALLSFLPKVQNTSIQTLRRAYDEAMSFLSPANSRRDRIDGVFRGICRSIRTCPNLGRRQHQRNRDRPEPGGDSRRLGDGHRHRYRRSAPSTQPIGAAFTRPRSCFRATTRSMPQPQLRQGARKGHYAARRPDAHHQSDAQGELRDHDGRGFRHQPDPGHAKDRGFADRRFSTGRESAGERAQLERLCSARRRT